MRVEWTDGFGASHISIAVTQFRKDDVDYAVIEYYGELRVVKVDLIWGGNPER